MVLCERHGENCAKLKMANLLILRYRVEIRALGVLYFGAECVYDICRRIIDIEVRNAALWDVFKTKRCGSWKFIEYSISVQTSTCAH